ncbi:hypothetical protein DUNSADRAFT_4600 [Dunaliella salina]|uniref:Encoded protein n=1 Tax=Dunaliella salina TaxID=3046 RepID=A0ABQ7GRR5_DUNSA|nr:hypothetical protein DUNSADRAFT_4600 [Dunaliella salina]|eukprot:KAF5837273.1 hypothetical protein DUNSADRAFT_4600 [Dunaliella salina]
MLAPEPLLPKDLRTPVIPPTQPLFGAPTPGAPSRPLRGPLLPPLNRTTTTTSSSHYQREGQLERSSYHHHTERRTLFGAPEEVRTAAH